MKISNLKKKAVRQWSVMALIAGLYFLLAKLAMSFAAVGGFAALVWPLTAFSFAILFLFGLNWWPGLAMGAFLANWSFGATLQVAWSIAAGNTLESIVGVLLLQRYGLSRDLGRVRDVLGLIFIGAMGSTLVSATIGTAALYLGGQIEWGQIQDVGCTWWLGDMLSHLLLTPLFLTWGMPNAPKLKRAQLLELFSVLLLVPILTWSSIFIPGFPVPSTFLLPLIIWTSLRFSQREMAILILTLSASGIWMVTKGIGPFGHGQSFEELLSLKIFLGIISVTGLILTAFKSESKGKEQKNHLLEQEIAERLRIEQTLILQDLIIKNMAEGLCLVRSADLSIVYTNPKFDEMLECQPGSRVGLPLSVLISPEEIVDPQQTLAAAIEELRQRGTALFEFLAYRPSGRSLYLRVNASTFDHPSFGEVWVALFQDISERKNAEERLKQANDELERKVRERTQQLAKERSELQAILNQMPIGVIILENETRRPLFVNRKVDEILRQPFPDWSEMWEFSRGERNSAGPSFWPLEKEEWFNGREVSIRRGDGTDGIIKINSAPIFYEKGKSSSAVLILYDITREKQDQEHMAFLSEAGRILGLSLEYEENLAQLSQLILDYLADGCFIDVLEEGDTITPLIVAHREKEKSLQLKKHRQSVKLALQRDSALIRVLRTGRTELVHDLPANDWIWPIDNESELEILPRLIDVQSAIILPLSASGKVFGALTLISSHPGRFKEKEDLKIVQELSRRMSLAIENARLFRNSQSAISMRDEFISIASHELKTPLTSLKIQLQMARRNLSAQNDPFLNRPALDQSLHKIARQVERLTQLIENLLDVSRIHWDKMKLETEEVDLGAVTLDLLERFSYELKLAKCHLILDIDKNITGHWDRLRIEQVLANLISNAVKYAPGKPLSITVCQTGDQDSSGKALFIIRDQGPGIPKDKQEKIFERFERATSSNVGGLGLGLFIASQMARAHKGQLQVHSEMGLGSEFLVELPRDPDWEKRAVEAGEPGLIRADSSHTFQRDNSAQELQ